MPRFRAVSPRHETAKEFKSGARSNIPAQKDFCTTPAFSRVVAASGGRTIYTAGQVSIDERGALVGAGDLAAQTAQAMRNVGLALSAAGASYADIVKITTYVVDYKPEHDPSSAKRERLSSPMGRRLRAPWSVWPRSHCRSGSSRSRPSPSSTEDKLRIVVEEMSALGAKPRSGEFAASLTPCGRRDAPVQPPPGHLTQNKLIPAPPPSLILTLVLVPEGRGGSRPARHLRNGNCGA
jgi:enamine deaminase RidA (YjgF/YER057c/UK114 family)